MTTFTTEDRQNANESPPHIVDSGASVIKNLDAYIDLEQRLEMYREQIQILQAEIQRRKRRMMEAGIDE